MTQGRLQFSQQPRRLIQLLTQANAVLIAVLANITPDQMHAPTPNEEWDVRALINYLVLSNA